MSDSNFKNQATENIRGKMLRFYGISMLVLLILVVSSVVVLSTTQTNSIETNVIHQTKIVDDGYETIIDDDFKLIKGLMSFIEEDVSLQNAFADKNRTLLGELTAPIYNEINAEYTITHFYYHLLNRTVFYRGHNPGSFGDTNNRATMLGAEDSGELFYGVELGKSGVFTLRVVKPWFNQLGEQIGYLELGEEIEHLTTKLSEITGNEITIAISKDHITEEQWDRGVEAWGKEGSWNDYSDFVIIDNTLKGDLPYASADDYTTGEVREFELSGNTYMFDTFSLQDASETTVGFVIVSQDETAALASANATMILLIVILLIVTVGLAVYFYYNVNNMVKEIEERQSETEKLNEELQGVVESLAKSYTLMNSTSFELMNGSEEITASSKKWLLHHNQ